MGAVRLAGFLLPIIRKAEQARCHGPATPLDRTESTAPGFSVAQLGSLRRLGSEPADGGSLSHPSVSLTLPFKEDRRPTHPWPLGELGF